MKLNSGTITSSFLFKKALQINSKIWSDPEPSIILSGFRLNFLAKAILREFPSASGYFFKFLDTFKYSFKALGLGPNADSLADSLILAFFY